MTGKGTGGLGSRKREEEGGGPSLPALPVIPYKAGNACLETGCSDCCRDTEMLLTEADIVRIQGAKPGMDFHFQADDGFLQLRTRNGPGDPTKPCVFLDRDGRCSIHAIRPEGCRLYPAVWDSERRRVHLDGEHCPHTDGFALPQATVDAVRRLAARLEAERGARSRRS